MNERSFIVKSDLSNPFSLMKTQHRSIFNTARHESRKDAPLRRKFRHSAQRDAPASFAVSRHGVQDFVSRTPSTACETTVPGCPVASNPGNDPRGGCRVNWQ